MARTLLRWIARITMLLGVTAVALLAGLWLWSGSEGSLATTLRWAGQRLPLTAEQVSGSLRQGGRAGQLVWNQEGLKVTVDDAELRWHTLALLQGRLDIEHLGARRIVVDDQSPSGGTQPAAFTLPLALQIGELRIGELRLSGPASPPIEDIEAVYDFDGLRHDLNIAQARFETGRYQARARLQAGAPLTLDARLTGTVAPELPSADVPLPLSLQATLKGPLAQLQLQATLQAMPGEPTENTPTATITAEIQPWAAQPLAQARAELQDIDVASLWHAAPRTRLSGHATLSPQPGPAGALRWALEAELANTTPGPWDRGLLPLQSLQADLLGSTDDITVRALHARAADGTVQAQGNWRAASAPAGDAGHWQLQAHFKGIHPAQLHTRLAAPPVQGSASARGDAQGAIDFDVALQSPKATEAATIPVERSTITLREAGARGRYEPGRLTLEQLRLSTMDAQAQGSLQLRWRGQALIGGRADLTAQAPGMNAAVQGTLEATTGAGTLQWQVGDAAKALAWLGRMPGLANAVPQQIAVRGQARLSGRWNGGWRTPELQAELASTALSITPRGAAPIELRQARAQLSGTLAQAQLTLQTEATQQARALHLQMVADGGRAQAASASRWHARLSSLAMDLSDPALGPGRWQLSLRQPVALNAATPDDWSIAAGELTLTSPAPEARAVLSWSPITHAQGRLESAGRIAGLPLQWAGRVLGNAAHDQGLGGNLILGGAWQLVSGDGLQLKAELARTSGDLMLRSDTQDGAPATRIAAGLSEARVTLASDGHALALELQWDSTHAGQARGELHSTLTTTPDASGPPHWSWPQDAPLQGALHARLPRIAAWSALAPPGWRLGGSLAADLAISGTRAAPRLAGTVTAEDLALRSVVDGIELGQGQLRARFADTRLVIDALSLHGPGKEGGEIQAHGEAGWMDGRLQARLQATLSRLRTSVRSDRDVTVSGRVEAALQDKTLKTEGTLHIDQARIELPDESRPALSSDVHVQSQQPPEGGKAGTTTPAADTGLSAQVDVGIALGDDFRVRGMGVDTRLAGQMRLSASGPLTQPPRLSGLVQTQGGRFRAYGQNLDITRGLIRFTGAMDNPALDIIALRPNFSSDQKVGVQVSGSALLPRISLYSEPALPDSQALAWLLLGHASPTDGAESAMLQSAALALLGGRNGRTLASRFGLDELSVARDTNGATANTSITLGKRLSERLYAAYEHSLAGTGSTLLIFYELSRRWSLRGQAGENAGLDLIYRLSFD